MFVQHKFTQSRLAQFSAMLPSIVKRNASITADTRPCLLGSFSLDALLCYGYNLIAKVCHLPFRACACVDAKNTLYLEILVILIFG
jgi:hypothetical protein